MFAFWSISPPGIFLLVSDALNDGMVCSSSIHVPAPPQLIFDLWGSLFQDEDSFLRYICCKAANVAVLNFLTNVQLFCLLPIVAASMLLVAVVAAFIAAVLLILAVIVLDLARDASLAVVGLAINVSLLGNHNHRSTVPSSFMKLMTFGIIQSPMLAYADINDDSVPVPQVTNICLVLLKTSKSVSVLLPMLRNYALQSRS